MLKSILLLGAALCAPTTVLAIERIECSVKWYKATTSAEKAGDPHPTTPAAVLDLAEATPTLFAGEFFNLTDACETPSVTSDVADVLSTYLSEAEAWSSRHVCDVKSYHDACSGVEDYSSSYLAPSVMCTSVLEAAETCPPSSAAATVSGRNGVAVLGGAIVAAVVAAAVGL